jgi:hypothetical protein
MEVHVALRRNLPRAIAIALGLGLLATGSVAAADTSSDGRPAAIISIGDSYISGEAGRWLGNSIDFTGDRGGTDRAFVDTPSGPTYDPTKVYGTTDANGCHRSDVAAITQIKLRNVTAINIACSGATTTNVLRGSNGGVGFKGEATQDDQLQVYSRLYKVKAIALTIGGNDFGFADIVTKCVLADIAPSDQNKPCNELITPSLSDRIFQVELRVINVINDISTVMTDAGYAPGSFKLVLTSYPIGLPAVSDMRYPEAGTARKDTGGCPFLDVDVQWGRDVATAQLAQGLRFAASYTHTQFLDTTGALQGHELCSSSAVQPTGSPDERTAEWLRWIDITAPGTQGNINESFHPNAFGQKALGRCLAFAFMMSYDLSCTAQPGKSTAYVKVSPLN